MDKMKRWKRILLFCMVLCMIQVPTYAQSTSSDSCKIDFTQDLYHRTKRKAKFYWKLNQTIFYPDTNTLYVKTNYPNWDSLFYFVKMGKVYRVDTILTRLTPGKEYTMDMSCCGRPFEIIQKPLKRVELEKRIAKKRRLDKDSLFKIVKKTGRIRVQLKNYNGTDTMVAFFGDFIGEHKVMQLQNGTTSEYMSVSSGLYGTSNYYFILAFLDPINDIYERKDGILSTDIHDGFYPVMQTFIKLLNRERVTCIFDYQARTWEFVID